MDTLEVEQLKEPLIYLRLHGLKTQPYMYGDELITAISVEQVKSVSLPRSLVFLEGCYGLQFADAFLDAGALAVMGSDAPTFGRRFFLSHATRVGRRFVQAVRWGFNAQSACEYALKIADDKENWVLVGEPGARLA